MSVDVLGTAGTPESLRNGRNFSQHPHPETPKNAFKRPKLPIFFSMGGAPLAVRRDMLVKSMKLIGGRPFVRW
jgi:hypothetical protein